MFDVIPEVPYTILIFFIIFLSATDWVLPATLSSKLLISDIVFISDSYFFSFNILSYAYYMLAS